MEFASIFWWTTLWLLFWGIVGSIGTRRIYLSKDLDISNAVLMGALIGASLGPLGLLFLWLKTPEASKKLIIMPSLLTVGILMTAFALADSREQLCLQQFLCSVPNRKWAHYWDYLWSDGTWTHLDFLNSGSCQFLPR